MRSFHKVLDQLAYAMSAVAALGLAIVAILVMLGTVTRYLFNYPLGEVVDLVGYLLLAMTFLCLPLLTARRMHVAIDLLMAQSLRMRSMLQRFIDLFSTLVLTAITWITLRSAISAWDQGLVTAAGYPVPRWWLLAVMCFGFALSTAIFLRRALARNPAMQAMEGKAK